jgi:hypothetical protein
MDQAEAHRNGRPRRTYGGTWQPVTLRRHGPVALGEGSREAIRLHAPPAPGAYEGDATGAALERIGVGWVEDGGSGGFSVLTVVGEGALDEAAGALARERLAGGRTVVVLAREEAAHAPVPAQLVRLVACRYRLAGGAR